MAATRHVPVHDLKHLTGYLKPIDAAQRHPADTCIAGAYGRIESQHPQLTPQWQQGTRDTQSIPPDMQRNAGLFAHARTTVDIQHRIDHTRSSLLDLHGQLVPPLLHHRPTRRN